MSKRRAFALLFLGLVTLAGVMSVRSAYAQSIGTYPGGIEKVVEVVGDDQLDVTADLLATGNCNLVYNTEDNVIVDNWSHGWQVKTYVKGDYIFGMVWGDDGMYQDEDSCPSGCWITYTNPNYHYYGGAIVDASVAEEIISVQCDLY